MKVRGKFHVPGTLPEREDWSLDVSLKALEKSQIFCLCQYSIVYN